MPDPLDIEPIIWLAVFVFAAITFGIVLNVEPKTKRKR